MVATPVPALDLAALQTQFNASGYCLARALLSADEVEEIRSLFARMHAKGVPGRYEPGAARDGVSDPQDPLYRYPRVMHPHRFNERARHFLLHPRVRAVLSALFGEDPLAAQSMYYFKPPGSRGQALHQDQFYLLVEPGTCCAAWIAIDDCDAENGAMTVVPQKMADEVVCPQASDRRVSFSEHFVPPPKGRKAVLQVMKAGDALFFNGSLIHGSGPNRSRTRFRRAFIGHYTGASVRRISRYYLPLVRMDGSDCLVEANTSGGPCGAGWAGAVH